MSFSLFARRRRGTPAATAQAHDAGVALPNTPAVVHNASVRSFAELFGDPAVFAARSFVYSLLVTCIAIIEGMAIYRMLPLKQGLLFQVETAPDASVSRVVEVPRFRPERRYLEAELSRWGQRMLVIDPYRTREELRLSTLWLRGKAVAEHREFIQKQAVFRRMQQTPGLVRAVEKSTAEITKDGLAFIFVTTSERSGSGEPKKEQWRFTVHYALLPQTEVDELLTNPLGLALTHFELTQEAR